MTIAAVGEVLNLTSKVDFCDVVQLHAEVNAVIMDDIAL